MNPGRAYFLAMMTVAGSVVGFVILFYIARKGGELYLDNLTRTGWARRFREWFLRYGLVTVFIPTLIPIPLPTKIFVLSAGAFGVRTMRFVLVVLAARIPRYLGLAYLGSQLGEHSTVWIENHFWILAGLAVALFIVLVFLVKLSHRFRKPS
jgi:uncharacterized membrane protein YdjX (TVP38/TMEM64 family)